MKDGLSSFDVLALAREFQGLVGGFVDKVYQRRDEVALRINVPGVGKREVYASVGRWLCLRPLAERPESPPPFAATLRQHLDNARVVEIGQRGFDRIVTVDFDRGHRLIFELFGKGNVVLLREGTTIAAYARAKFRDRTVAPGAPYAFPPEASNPFALSAEEFTSSLRGGKGAIVKALASGMNLGGAYAEEVCLRAGIDKNRKVETLDGPGLARIHSVLLDLHRQVSEARDPRVVLEEEVPVDATPVPLAQHATKPSRSFPTFNEALAFYIDHAPPPAPAESDAAAKLRRRLEQQQGTLTALRTEAVQSEALAAFLFSHYGDFEDLIRRASEGNLAPEGSVVEVDRPTHSVRVAVGDITEVSLDWTLDVRANAQKLYERKKAALAKMKKVEEAIAETQRRIASSEKAERKAASRPTVKPTKAFWFEAYRWFVSSEGYLVIGGRDAKTNDAVVKKHLKDGDRYVHADIHGAPSCVVKEGSKASEKTLHEACAFALAWSKAWTAGLASGSAFWVLPEQVSKQAESGEYVGRGAWVVRGKRNYAHDLSVRAAIGEVEHQGHRKVMAGPPGAVSARSSRYVVIEPGEEDKASFARRAARALQVPAEEAMRVLPPGGIRVISRLNLDA